MSLNLRNASAHCLQRHAQAWVKTTQVADSEAAERRLKAALAAKRETSVVTNGGEIAPNTAPKVESSPDGGQSEERMDVDAVTAEGLPEPTVRLLAYLVCHLFTSCFTESLDSRACFIIRGLQGDRTRECL